jgi:hypothetical protein
MFDVLDVLVPDFSTCHADIRPTPTVFGPADDRTYHGVRLGHLALAGDVYRDAARADWTVLVAADAANRAAESDQCWAVFLEGLVLILAQQREWRVTCESDCDQYPCERLRCSPADLSQRLDSYRRRRHFPIALVASSTCVRRCRCLNE